MKPAPQNAELLVIEFIISPDSNPLAPRSHHGIDQTLVVLQGRLEITDGTKTWHVAPGRVFVVPAGAAHGLRTANEEPVTVLTIHTPSKSALAMIESLAEASKIVDRARARSILSRVDFHQLAGRT